MHVSDVYQITLGNRCLLSRIPDVRIVRAFTGCSISEKFFKMCVSLQMFGDLRIIISKFELELHFASKPRLESLLRDYVRTLRTRARLRSSGTTNVALFSVNYYDIRSSLFSERFG